MTTSGAGAQRHARQLGTIRKARNANQTGDAVYRSFDACYRVPSRLRRRAARRRTSARVASGHPAGPYRNGGGVDIQPDPAAVRRCSCWDSSRHYVCQCSCHVEAAQQ